MEETVDVIDQIIEGIARKHAVEQPSALAEELRAALRDMGYEIAKISQHVPGSARW